MQATVDYQSLRFDYRRHADQDAAQPARHPVVVVGAGPVGLALAIDLAQRGVPVVLLDNDDRLSSGSRAICFAKRTLEIFDRLGCGDAIRASAAWRSWCIDRGLVACPATFHHAFGSELFLERREPCKGSLCASLPCNGWHVAWGNASFWFLPRPNVAHDRLTPLRDGDLLDDDCLFATIRSR